MRERRDEPTAFLREQPHAVLAFFALWTVFVAMEVLKDWYLMSANGWAFPLGRHLGQSAFIFYPWFAISLLAGVLIWRLPRYARGVEGYGLHTLIAFAVGLAHVLLIAVSFWIFFPRSVAQASFGQVFLEQLLEWLHFEVLVYFAVFFCWRVLLRRQRSAPAAGGHPKRALQGKIDGETHVAPLERIDWIESADNYVIAHVGDRHIKIRETLKHLESWLDADRFLRVHRKAIVNMDRLRQYAGTELTLSNGDRVTCSRSGKRALVRFLATRTPRAARELSPDQRGVSAE